MVLRWWGICLFLYILFFDFSKIYITSQVLQNYIIDAKRRTTWLL
jgi:hypothetical protein